MHSVRQFLALCCYGWLVSSVVASSSSSSIPSLSSIASSVPGLFPKELTEAAVAKEIRKMIVDYSAQRNATMGERTLREIEEDELFKAGPNQQSLRHLVESSGGKWDEVNLILSTIEINIPHIEITQEALGLDIFASINGTCNGIQVGDVLLDWDKDVSPREEVLLAYKIQLLGAQLKCYVQLDYNTGVLDISDNIKMKVKLDESNFGVAAQVEGSPPVNSTFLGCKVRVNIGDIASSGGFTSDLINDLNYLLVGLIRDQGGLISGLICDTLFGFTETVDDLLATFGDFLDPFITEFVPVDPLYLENNLPPGTPELVSFRDTEGLGNIVNVLLTNLEGIISATQLNVLITAVLLDGDPNGVFTLELGEVPTLAPTVEGQPADRFLQVDSDSLLSDDLTGPIQGCIPNISDLFEVPELPIRGRRDRRLGGQFNDYLQEHRSLQLEAITDVIANLTLDQIINTTDLFVVNEITPIRVSVAGLNQFTDAAPLQVIGDYTLLTGLNLNAVYVEAELYLDVEINGIPIQSTIVAEAEVRGIALNTSYVIGLSQEQVDQWTIGTFLNTSNIVGCLVSALEVFGFSQFELTVDLIGTPAISGFFSNAVTDLANTGVDGVICAYQDLITGAIPGFVQNNLTQIINDFAACYIATSNATCVQSSLADLLDIPTDTEGDVDFDFRRRSGTPKQKSSGSKIPGFLDFRDLLLPPDQARELGASGRQPYGDLMAMVFTMMSETVTAIDNETGVPAPAINSFLPEDGLQLDMDLLDYNLDLSEMDIISTLLQSASLYVHNMRVQNLNTLTAPLSFLEPTRNPHVLANLLNFGGPSIPRSLNMTATVETALLGNNSGLAMMNDVDAGGSVSEIDLAADLQVLISTMDFLNFPINDIGNFNCWMALVQTGTVDGEKIYGFEITRMLLDIAQMSFDLKCLNCTSELLPAVVTLLENVGATEVLGNRVGPLIEEIVTSDLVSPLVKELLGLGDIGARKCPHSPLYNTTANETVADLGFGGLGIEIPPLSRQGVDTVLYTGILGAELFAVVFAESHLDNDLELSDPLSGEKSLNVTDDVNLLNWYRLNETFIPFADDIFDLVNGFLGPTEDGELGINGLFGDSFNFSLGFGVDLIEGYDILIDSVQLDGMDSFKDFDILEPVGPQTLKNTIVMDNLTVSIDFSINVTETSDPAIPYRVSFDLTDVNATVYLFTAIDMDEIEALQIGQLLFISNILPCFLAASVDVHVPAMRVEVGNMTQPVFEGLLPDTNQAARASLQAVFDRFGGVIAEAMNSIFDSTIRTVVNDFVQGFIEDTSACMTSEEIYADSNSVLIDFRDLLLSSEDALLLGGSGTQPYGDVVSTAYSLVLDQLASNGTGQLLDLNSFIEDFSLSQSGEVGMLRLEDELIDIGFDFAMWIEEKIRVSAFDARIRNLNTLVSPIAVAHPTTHPYVLENMINFGPIAGMPLNATVGALLELEGDLKSLDMFNMFDLSGEMNEINIVAAMTLHILTENLMAFPVRDVFEPSCWLSLLQNPNATEFDAGASGFRFESVLAKLATLSIDSNCLNCTSRVLDDAIALVDEAGASETFGNRLGFLIEDLATSDAIPTLLKEFGLDLGDDAGRSCPHHPLFNTTSNELEDASTSLTIPALSAVSIDTLLFAGVIFGEIAVVIGADNHLQHPGEPTDPLHHQKALDVPEGVNLIDWRNLEGVGIPFMAEALDLVRGFVGADEPGQEPGVNGLLSSLTDVNGTFELALDAFSFEQAGVLLTVNYVRAVGLDNFTEFEILQPIAPQTMQNKFYLESLQVTLDVSIDVLESTDAPNNFTVTLEMEGINASVPLFAAVDEDKLGALKLGQLLFLENALPCILSTTYGVQVEEMNIAVRSLSEPVFGGFLPDTSESVEKSTRAVWDMYGEMIEESIPLVMQDTLRVFINSVLASYGEDSCETYPTNSSLHYIDFRQMFQPSNSTAYSPYGDIIPMAREMLEEELFAVNPETQMPRINDRLIAPFTEDQSGVEGTLLLPGKIFGFDSDDLSGLGIGNVGVELFDARIENLDTVGEPLHVAEPNKTRADLLDNGATFGTQFSPLRFAIRGTLSTVSPFAITHDEMDVFGELRSAPILAVLLARIGAEEFLDFPLGYTSDVNCWLGTLAAPALKAIQEGDMDTQPIMLIDYLNIAFQSMRISASCYNCTTGGLEVVPDLLEILETTTSKNVLGYRNVDLFLNLLSSDFAQVWILRIFQDSIRKCEYTSNSTLRQVIVPEADFPHLSDYHMETGVFTVTVFIQLGLVILAETIADLEGIEPFFDDPVPDIPPGTRLVDFTALDEFPTGALALQMIDMINDFLGTEQVDEETGEVTLGISTYLELGSSLGPTVGFDLAFDQFEFNDEIDVGISSLKVRMKGMTISGLDTFTRFAIANITGPTTMRHELGWERLQIDIKMEIDITGEETDLIVKQGLDPNDPANDGLYQFSLTIELADVLAIADTFMALDYELLKYLELGNFLRFDYILPCIQATVLHLELSDMHLEIGRVSRMAVSGFQSPDVQTAATELEATLLEKYGETIASMAPNVFSAGMRPLMNTVINDYLRESDYKCDEFPFDPTTNGFIDFRDLLLAPEDSLELGGTGKEQYGDIIHTFFGFSSPLLRFLILPMFEDGLSLEGDLINEGIRFDVRQFKSVFVLKVSDVEVVNFHKVGSLDYTVPVDGEPYLLDNDITIGIGRFPLGIKFRIFFAFKGLGEQLAGVDIHNDFAVTLDIKSLNFLAQTLLRVSEEAFVKFPLRNVLNLNCWLATIPPPEVDERGFKVPGTESNLIMKTLAVAMKEMNMEVECFNCTSSGLIEFNELLQQPGVSDDLTEQVSQWITELIATFGDDFLQDQIDNLIYNAPKYCPHSDNLDPNAPPFQFNPAPVISTDDTVYLAYLLAIVIPLVLAVILIMGVRTTVHRRHRKWISGLPSERVFLIQQKQEKEDQFETELNEMTNSMFESTEVPLIARYLLPFIVVVNIGFFLSGHLSLGGRAMLDITIAGENFRVDNFYDFSIAQSTLDLWHAGGEELATLVLLFSGIWPYTKQLITLALWFLPPSVVSVSRRGTFLLWLDILAKWSMIDIFVLLITVAGFRIGAVSPYFSFLPEEFYNVQLVVIPMWGLYANMIAQLMSQISSHFIVMYHRRILKSGKLKYKERHHPTSKPELAAVEQVDMAELLSPDVPQEEKKDQLCKHPFIRPHKVEGPRLVPRRVVNGFLPICTTLLGVLLVFCCYWPSLRLEAYGLIGILMDFGHLMVKSVREESIFTKAKILIDQAKYLDEVKHYIGNGFLAILYITTLLVVPLVSLGTMMYMWLVPTTRKQKEKVAILLEILQAWQYVEVYMLGIIIESWQLGEISKLFINRYCEQIDPLLQLAASYDIIEARDAQCFELAASIAQGAYALIPFVIGLAMVGTYVIKAYIQTLREQHDEEQYTTEEEKLRAFDRTTWDNRESALENVRDPPVLFTDTFRWTLYSMAGTEDDSLDLTVADEADFAKPLDTPTYPVADTSDSDGYSNKGDAAVKNVPLVEESLEDLSTDDFDDVKASPSDYSGDSA